MKLPIILVSYAPLPEEDIVKAFQLLDYEKTGIIAPEVLEEHLMKQGNLYNASFS